MLITNMALPALKSFSFLLEQDVKNQHCWWISEMQKCLQNNSKKQPYECHLPCWCTRSLSLPPTFPFRFGTMGTPLRVQVWGRITENTLRWVSKLLPYSVPLSNPAYLIYLRNNSSWLHYWGLCRQHSAINLFVYTCVRTCICMCLIGIVSISKRPDSHPPSLWNKGRPADDAVGEPGSAVCVYVCTSRDRETYCQCKRYCKCFCIRGAMCSIYKHRHMVIKLMVTLKND